MKKNKSSFEAQKTATFISQGRNFPKKKNGRSRYDDRKDTTLDGTSSGWWQQDVNMLFKTGNYVFTVPVYGSQQENTYQVTIQINGFLDVLNKTLSTSTFSVPAFQQSLMTAMNLNDIKVSCTCPDFRYRFARALTNKDNTSGRPETRPSPITNPTEQEGCCKHILYVLNNKVWSTKVARTLFNYIVKIWKDQKSSFDKLIRPALNNISDEKILGKPEKVEEQPPVQEPEEPQAEQSADIEQGEANESLEDRNLVEEAILHFGVTSSPSKAGFILPDGRMLDFSEGQRYRTADHRDISILYNDLEGNDALVDFMQQTGSIRVDYESSRIDIDIAHEPTDIQYKKLRSFIHSGEDVYLDFSKDGNYLRSYELEDKDATYSSVLDIIKSYFRDGTFKRFATEAINSYYQGNTQFDDDQNLALAVCKNIGADVEIYVTPENTPEQIEELGQQLHDGVADSVIRELADPLLPYISIRTIARASLQGIDLLPYKDFAPDALEQIVRGVKLGVPIDKIALRGFNSRQIEQLVRAYKRSPRLYDAICDRKINYNKMRELMRTWKG